LVGVDLMMGLGSMVSMIFIDWFIIIIILFYMITILISDSVDSCNTVVVNVVIIISYNEKLQKSAKFEVQLEESEEGRKDW